MPRQVACMSAILYEVRGYAIAIARAISIQNSLQSSLERRLRVLDELQLGRDASYERCRVIIFAIQCFSADENVRHHITPLSPCCSWSLSTTVDASATHYPNPT